EVGLETTQHGGRPFDQAFDLVQVAGIDAGHAAGGPRRGFYLAHDALATLDRVDQHERVAQRIDVVGGRTDPHRALVHEAVAAAHAVRSEPEQFAVDDLVAVQQHQPVHRAGKA